MCFRRKVYFRGTTALSRQRLAMNVKRSIEPIKRSRRAHANELRNAFWESDAYRLDNSGMSVAANKEGTREEKKSHGKGSMMTKQAAGGCGGWGGRALQSCTALNGVNEGLRVYRHKSPRRTEKGDDRRQRDTFDRPSFFFLHPPWRNGNSLCKLGNRNINSARRIFPCDICLLRESISELLRLTF